MLIKYEDLINKPEKTFNKISIYLSKMLNIKIKWVGKGISEKAYEIKKNKKILMIKIDKKYFRPLDINYLKGDPSKAKRILKYKIKYKFKDLVEDMILSDIYFAKKKISVKNWSKKTQESLLLVIMV